jgi:hypothetical protein
VKLIYSIESENKTKPKELKKNYNSDKILKVGFNMLNKEERSLKSREAKTF